jgi:predicted amidohydrolase YtcJ
MSEVVRLPHLLLVDVEVDGRRGDVHVRDGRVLAVGEQLPRPDGADVRHAGGGALLPGLHDHHVHLLATAAARTSVPCGPPEVADLAGLRRALRAAPADRAVRGTGYHDDVAGPLDRLLLDELVPDRPARVQHRSGAVWTLNSRALHEVGLPAQGDGRLWRGDPALRPSPRHDEVWPDLAGLGRELAHLGVLGVSDATPDTDPAAAARIAAADLPQQVRLMGVEQDPSGTPAPRKVLLADEDDLDWHALLALVRDTHAAGRPVAVHTVTRASLVAVLSVLEATGAVPGDRLEHAAVVPPDLVGAIARLGLCVVTQPAMAAARGDDYLRDVDPCDRDDLWPYASLLAAGVAVAPSSDAPYGPLDPWTVLRQSRDRRTPSGAVLRPAERVPVRQALDGLLSPLEQPGGPPRRVEVGAPADLVLLDAPLAEALREPSCERVRLVVAAR